jgi:acetyl-CoA carboxylase biotin carboxyl carrier protein
MDLRELKALLNLMHENGLVELELEDKKGKVRLVRGTVALHDHQPKQAAVAIAPSKAQPRTSSKVTASTVSKSAAAAIELQDNQKMVESPMVGTFYRAASPDSEPFVEEGTQVRKGQPLCLIEAMKMMNEIEAEIGGKLVKIICENGQPVEYGQPLMIIEAG